MSRYIVYQAPIVEEFDDLKAATEKVMQLDDARIYIDIEYHYKLMNPAYTLEMWLEDKWDTVKSWLR
jgi:hypothetical protein